MVRFSGKQAAIIVSFLAWLNMLAMLWVPIFFEVDLVRYAGIQILNFVIGFFGSAFGAGRSNVK